MTDRTTSGYGAPSTARARGCVISDETTGVVL
jgi:hypothetical protein